MNWGIGFLLALELRMTGWLLLGLFGLALKCIAKHP